MVPLIGPNSSAYFEAELSRANCNKTKVVTTLTTVFQSLKSKCVELETAAQSSVIRAESVSTVSSAPPMSPGAAQSSEKTVIHGSTIVTRVEERSTFDVSRLVADLDARDAELTILRAVLSQKENQLQVRIAGSII